MDIAIDPCARGQFDLSVACTSPSRRPLMTTTCARISPSITPCSATVRLHHWRLRWQSPCRGCGLHIQPPLNSTSPRITTWLPIRHPPPAGRHGWICCFRTSAYSLCWPAHRPVSSQIPGWYPRTTPQCHPHALRGEVSRQHHAAGELLEVPERVILSRHLAALVQIIPADRGQLAVLHAFHGEAHLPLADGTAVEVLGQHGGVLPGAGRLRAELDRMGVQALALAGRADQSLVEGDIGAQPGDFLIARPARTAPRCWRRG